VIGYLSLIRTAIEKVVDTMPEPESEPFANARTPEEFRQMIASDKVKTYDTLEEFWAALEQDDDEPDDKHEN